MAKYLVIVESPAKVKTIKGGFLSEAVNLKYIELQTNLYIALQIMCNSFFMQKNLLQFIPDFEEELKNTLSQIIRGEN